MQFRKCACPPQCSGPVAREGARILAAIISTSHAINKNDGVSLKAIIDQEMFDRLCIWQSQCEGCEAEPQEELEQDDDSNQM